MIALIIYAAGVSGCLYSVSSCSPCNASKHAPRFMHSILEGGLPVRVVACVGKAGRGGGRDSTGLNDFGPLQRYVRSSYCVVYLQIEG